MADSGTGASALEIESPAQPAGCCSASTGNRVPFPSVVEVAAAGVVAVPPPDSIPARGSA